MRMQIQAEGLNKIYEGMQVLSKLEKFYQTMQA